MSDARRPLPNDSISEYDTLQTADNPCKQTSKTE